MSFFSSSRKDKCKKNSSSNVKCPCSITVIPCSNHFLPFWSNVLKISFISPTLSGSVIFTLFPLRSIPRFVVLYKKLSNSSDNVSILFPSYFNINSTKFIIFYFYKCRNISLICDNTIQSHDDLLNRKLIFLD